MNKQGKAPYRPFRVRELFLAYLSFTERFPAQCSGQNKQYSYNQDRTHRYTKRGQQRKVLDQEKYDYRNDYACQNNHVAYEKLVDCVDYLHERTPSCSVVTIASLCAAMTSVWCCFTCLSQVTRINEATR